MTCDARMRPFTSINDTEISCGEEGNHTAHRGVLRDYAYPGSVTTIQWFEADRRTFHGEWPGACPGCILPLGHRGDHAE